MTRLISILIISTICLLTAAQDKPNKPHVNPKWDSKKVEKGFEDALGPTGQRPKFQEWENKAMWPEGCRREAEYAKRKADDFKVYSVFYADCSEPWHMCVHKDADKEHLANMFGRVPVAMRSYVRTLVVQLKHPNKESTMAHCYGNDITAFMKIDMRGMTHEIGHAMDNEGLRDDLDKEGKNIEKFSTSKTWKEAVGKDSNVATDYAETSWGENFAEMIFLGVFVKNVPNPRDKNVGPWDDGKKWDGFKNQLDLVIAKVGDKLTVKKDSKCTKRVQNDQAVPKNAKTPKRELGLRPDLRIRDSSIQIIEMDTRNEEYTDTEGFQ